VATGIVDEDPALPGIQKAIKSGMLRYCPICDGYEAMDQRIAVLGTIDGSAKKALFLRTYSADVVLLLTEEPSGEDESKIAALHARGVTIAPGVVRDIEKQGNKIVSQQSSGERCEVDVLYPALGCQVRSELAGDLGARRDDMGCLVVDQDQRTGIPGLFAAGDVVSDLHQLSVGVGHAAIAATAIHNGLSYNFR